MLVATAATLLLPGLGNIALIVAALVILGVVLWRWHPWGAPGGTNAAGASGASGARGGRGGAGFAPI